MTFFKRLFLSAFIGSLLATVAFAECVPISYGGGSCTYNGKFTVGDRETCYYTCPGGVKITIEQPKNRSDDGGPVIALPPDVPVS